MPSNRASLSIAIATAAAVIVYLVADSQPGPPDSREAREQRLIRLADLLGDARVESPLTGVTVADRLELLEEAPRETVFEEDFESFDMLEAGWLESPLAEVEKTEQGHAFLLRQMRLDSGRYGWVIPAQPNTHYVFERFIKANGPLNADLAIVERKTVAVPGTQRRFSPNTIAGAELSLKLHWPAQQDPDGSWQRGRVSFFTTSNTHSLAIVIRATSKRREHLFRWGATNEKGAQDETRFDDIRLDRIAPTPQQAIALMKSSALADGADPDLGIAKYGQFPPVGDIGSEYSAKDDNYSYKYALYAPPPTDLSFSLNLAENATLRFSACLSKETASGDAGPIRSLGTHGR